MSELTDDMTRGLRIPGRTYSIAELRTWDTTRWDVGFFCPLCACTKSGYVEDPNNGSEWCEDARCPCHRDDAYRG